MMLTVTNRSTPIPLAVTSNNRMIKLLGGKRWLLLHRLVYLCAVGGVVHYWWLVKKDLTNPMTFALLLSLLLGIRLINWLRGLNIALIARKGWLT